MDPEPESEDPMAGGGGVVCEYGEPILFGPGERDPTLAVEVELHLANHLGPVEEVFHEPCSDTVEVEVLRVDPTEERPYHLLVTCGMAQRPMPVPAGFEQRQYCELMLALPDSWPLDESDLEGDAGWPLRLLQELAHSPHQQATWLGLDQTIPNGESLDSYASDTHLCGCLLESPRHLCEASRHLHLSDGRHVHFLHVTPLYADEIDYGTVLGAAALTRRFAELEVPMVVDPHRRCVVNPDLPGAAGAARARVLGTPWWRCSN